MVNRTFVAYAAVAGTVPALATGCAALPSRTRVWVY
jgi:hypothetical protein